MKVIRNSICYVEKNDILFLGMLPEEIVEAPFIVESKWVKFENQKAVNFFRETEVIIDYDELSNKKEEELLETENKVEKELNDICTKWLYASSYYRRNLDKVTSIPTYKPLRPYSEYYKLVSVDSKPLEGPLGNIVDDKIINIALKKTGKKEVKQLKKVS